MTILLSEQRGHIRILTINRPERMNAMSPELSEALIEGFVEAGADPDIRVIILTGVGDRAFCAGADLKARAQEDAEGKPFQPLLSRVQRYIFEVVYETIKPTIAALNGTAVAGRAGTRAVLRHPGRGRTRPVRPAGSQTRQGRSFRQCHAAAHGAARYCL